MSDQTVTTSSVKPRARLDLATNLRQAVLRLSRRLRQGSTLEVSQAQYSVLSALFHLGPMTPGRLAEYDHVTRPSMTRTVASLEGRGLVLRRPAEEDRRCVLVEVTGDGAALVKEIKRRRTAWLDKRLARLTPAERQTLSDAVVILRRMVEE
ncbi:MarR family winged helix-turn-helix transcriptional regulator [Sediminivirga luteola]|uniref:MarR family transcriptional regulator n=1 Tax=Sediminivirga luteola TaxID=1774748 RepID=A0A8J2TZ92_9MICO|nr:MarR family transcriptional regulator [Sediminivirga luteola]MCI2267112.1 MarR family transcriptional regulator [Sediminivirga luteola]GGA19887.1 MarR family transcriptional regulator [Sediminivirga luteola]